MYLNWNPSLLPHREDIHFTWDLSAGNGISGSFVTSPQFAFTTANTSGPVWLLLSRHFKTDDGQGQNTGFISICVFDNTDCKRVYLSDRTWRHGPFVDSPNALLRLETPANRTYTVVPSVHNLTKSNHNFTLSAFSTWPLTLSHAAEKYAYCTKFESAWTLSTAGGNTESPRYLSNPQFSVQITEQPCSVAIFLETTSKEIAANVKLLWSNGRRVTSTIGLRDIAVDSGDYRRGCALAELEDIPRGSFTLVCSTFKEDQLGKFTVWVHSTKPCLAKPLPAESAGRLSIPVEPAVFHPGVNRILAPLTVHRLTRLKELLGCIAEWAKNKSTFSDFDVN
ncbi:cysteine protease [Ascosphaera aggregata]|nr:cysteine protease [Ascosphaera aggregata]